MNSNYDNEAEGDLKKPFLHTGSWLLSSAIAIRESQISVVACVLIEALGPIQFGFTAGYSSPTQSAITGDLVSSSLALSRGRRVQQKKHFPSLKRMKMIVGFCILRDTAPCLVLF